MTSYVYTSALWRLLNGDLDLGSGTYKVSLHTGDYSPDVDADEFFSDLTGETSGDGYTAGGLAIGSVSLSRNDAENRIEFSADDATWEDPDFSFRYAVLYKDTGTAGTSPLLVCFDFETTLTTSGPRLVLQWDGDGGIFIVRQGG